MSPIRIDAFPPPQIQALRGRACACPGVLSLFDRAAEREQVEHPPEFEADVARFKRLIHSLIQVYGDSLDLRVWNLASPLAVLQSLRYWIRETPAFIIEGRVRVVGWNLEALYRAVEEALGRKAA